MSLRSLLILQFFIGSFEGLILGKLSQYFLFLFIYLICLIALFISMYHDDVYNKKDNIKRISIKYFDKRK